MAVRRQEKAQIIDLKDGKLRFGRGDAVSFVSYYVKKLRFKWLGDRQVKRKEVRGHSGCRNGGYPGTPGEGQSKSAEMLVSVLGSDQVKAKRLCGSGCEGIVKRERPYCLGW